MKTNNIYWEPHFSILVIREYEDEAREEFSSSGLAWHLLTAWSHPVCSSCSRCGSATGELSGGARRSWGTSAVLIPPPQQPPLPRASPSTLASTPCTRPSRSPSPPWPTPTSKSLQLGTVLPLTFMTVYLGSHVDCLLLYRITWNNSYFGFVISRDLFYGKFRILLKKNNLVIH